MSTTLSMSRSLPTRTAATRVGDAEVGDRHVVDRQPALGVEDRARRRHRIAPGSMRRSPRLERPRQREGNRPLGIGQKDVARRQRQAVRDHGPSAAPRSTPAGSGRPPSGARPPPAARPSARTRRRRARRSRTASRTRSPPRGSGPGRAAPSSTVRQRTRLDPGVEPGWVELVGGRCEEQVDALRLGHGRIGRLVARVAREVIGRVELRRVDEEAHDHDVGRLAAPRA